VRRVIVGLHVFDPVNEDAKNFLAAARRTLGVEG
jgi:hypothetical protein